ncbi:MAG: PmoA family protein, partial [Planctomycetaceae bacterium]|nr:PmoA family protein [Planctomycetaceae bacterium]
MRSTLLISSSLLVCALAGHVIAADIVVEKTDSGIAVKVGDQPFTTYIFQSKVKPILWPVIGPTGKEMTRAWPMREGNPDEKTDHPHQRSFWFTHGEVNGIDFWAEAA